MDRMTPKQRKAFDAALALSKTRDAERDAVPTQRTRAAFQGLSFGTADEIEARAVSLATGRTYDEVLAEIRGGLKAYKEARPAEAMAFEIGGAILPAFLPGGQASLARAAGRAALEGGAYAFGSGEGGFSERASSVLPGMVGGAAGGAAGYGAVKGAARLLSAAKSKLGMTGATKVNSEIQRLVKQTGMSADQVSEAIIDGRLLAENKSIQAAVRALRTQGGEASTVLQRGMEARPEQTRSAAMAAMRTNLGDAGEGSQVAARRASEEATIAAERQAYGSLQGMQAPEQVVSALADTLRRVPSAAKEVEIKFQAETGNKPFFSIADDGAVSFSRTPTVDEAESIRRAVQNRATSLYRSEGMGGAGEAVSGVAGGLREILDYSIPELSSARAQAAAVRSNRDAYTAGSLALAGDINEKIADFYALRQGENAAEAVASFRAGLMKLLEARATTGSRQSMIRNLLTPETKENKLLLEVFPEDQLDEVLKSLDIARDAQEAAGKVLIGTGSQTTETAQEIGRQGMGAVPADVMGAISGDPSALLSIAGRLVRSTAPALNDADRAAVARMLVSQNAELVKSALTDRTAAEKLSALAARMARSTGAQGGARVPNYFASPER